MHNGEIKSSARLKDFKRKMLPKIFESFFYSIIFFLIAFIYGGNFKELDINGDFLQVFSGILGFAITALAILLSSLDKIVSYIESRKTTFDSKVVISDMTFPIAMILLLMLLNILLLIFENGYIKSFFSLFTFIYGILLTFELVHTMFLIGMALIKEYSQSGSTEDSGDINE